jgi:hypothetical protein
MKKLNQLLEDIKSAQKELSAWPTSIRKTFVLEGRVQYFDEQDRSNDKTKELDRRQNKKVA